MMTDGRNSIGLQPPKSSWSCLDETRWSTRVDLEVKDAQQVTPLRTNIFKL
jgi:hypothetical protein